MNMKQFTPQTSIGDRKNSKTVPHGMILGVAGSGRQEIAMRDIIEMMQKYPEDHFYVIDPCNEYYNRVMAQIDKISDHTVAAELKRKIANIDFTQDGCHINPLDFDSNYDRFREEAVLDKVDYVFSVISELQNAPLGKEEMEIVHQSVKSVYDRYEAQLQHTDCSYDSKYAPTFKDIYNELKKTGSDTSNRLAILLELIATENYEYLLSHPTDLNNDKTIVFFTCNYVPDSLRRLVMSACLEFVWSRLYIPKRYVWVYQDSIGCYFRNEWTSRHCLNVWKRARMAAAIMTGIDSTSRISDNPHGQAILNNTSTVVLLEQSKEEAEWLKERYMLSEDEIEMILNSKSGCGIII